MSRHIRLWGTAMFTLLVVAARAALIGQTLDHAD